MESRDVLTNPVVSRENSQGSHSETAPLCREGVATQKFVSLVAHLSPSCALECPGCYWKQHVREDQGNPWLENKWEEIIRAAKELGAEEVTFAVNDGETDARWWYYIKLFEIANRLEMSTSLTLSPLALIGMVWGVDWKELDPKKMWNSSIEKRILKTAILGGLYDFYISVDPYKEDLIDKISGWFDDENEKWRGITGLVRLIGTHLAPGATFHINLLPYPGGKEIRSTISIPNPGFASGHLVYFKEKTFAKSQTAKEELLSKLTTIMGEDPTFWDLDSCITLPANEQPCKWGRSVVDIDAYGRIRGCSYTDPLAVVRSGEEFHRWVEENYPLKARYGCSLVPIHRRDLEDSHGAQGSAESGVSGH